MWFVGRWLVLLCLVSVVRGGGKCEEITIPMCKGIGYNYTRLPNQFNHQTQDEAGLEVHQFWPLVEIKCSPDLRFFLCSMYTPICIESYLNPLPACRSVCERARLGCVPLMQQYGFAWPKRMSCEKLPMYGGKDLCMDAKAQDAETRAVDISGSQYTSPTYKKPPRTLPPFKGSILTGHDGTTCQCHQCGRSGSLLQASSHGEDMEMIYGSNEDLIEGMGSYLVKLQPGDEYYNQSLQWAGQQQCTDPCFSPHFSKVDREFMELWLAVWSIICCFSTSITFITFLIDSSRFSYPERPIMFISFCYLLISVGFIIRVSLGHEAVSCQYQKHGQVASYNNRLISRVSLQPTEGSLLCATVFVLVYFFWMASNVWWVVLTFTWFLSAGLKWAQESISSYSTWYHFMAWALPMAQTIAALLTYSVDGDTVAGLCQIKNNKIAMQAFVIIPLCAYLILGIIFLSTGFISLFRIRSIIKSHGASKIDKLEKLMIKIGIFSMLYIIPAGSVIAVAVYEMVSVDGWEKTLLCPSCVPKHSRSRPDFSVLLLKYLMMLAVGITSGFWIWSGKTLDSWTGCFSRMFRFSPHNKERIAMAKIQAPLPATPAQGFSSQQTLGAPGHYSRIELEKKIPLTHV